MSFTDTNNYSFYVNEICKERIRKILNETDISETNKNIITIGMLLY